MTIRVKCSGSESNTDLEEAGRQEVDETSVSSNRVPPGDGFLKFLFSFLDHCHLSRKNICDLLLYENLQESFIFSHMNQISTIVYAPGIMYIRGFV